MTGNRCHTLKWFPLLFLRQINRLKLSFTRSFRQRCRWKPSIIKWFLKKQHTTYQNIFPQSAWENESYGKYYFGPLDRQGKFHTAWQFTLFWAFSKILCHLWLQWAECISYTCATRDTLLEPSLCIVATLAAGGSGVAHCLPGKCIFKYGSKEWLSFSLIPTSCWGTSRSCIIWRQNIQWSSVWRFHLEAKTEDKMTFKLQLLRFRVSRLGKKFYLNESPENEP